ncbi:MAG: DUF4153 domain-containing protein [Balneolaceae bacterium]
MKLSIPSVDQITEAIASVLKRFPLVVFVSIVGTISAICLTDLSFASQEEYPRLLAVCFVSGLGISFLLAIATFLERKEWSTAGKSMINTTGIALLITYYFILSDHFIEGPNEIWYRFFLFILGSHLFVAFAPFTSSSKLDQFWEYNKSLFLRILLSVLYSGVLFVGLSIALLAIDNLLGLNVEGETYLKLFLFLGGIFNTWFFLAGVPQKEEIQSKAIIFPTGLRVFVQYVLIPLVTVYIFILYLYLGKIIIQWELPNGWVSNLVLSFSIAGLLSLLLLYPIRNSKEFKWVSFYSKYYYLLLIPLIILLMFSIWVRISEYGVTINRYFVATLGVWLTGIVIYFIFSKVKNIKVIPISLCLITLVVSVGPMGAFAVSERSQLGKFEVILDRNGMLDESNKIIPKKEGEEVTFEERKELSSIVDYVVENHSTKEFGKYFDQSIHEIIKDSTTYKDSEKIVNALGINYVEYWENEETVSQFFRIASSGEFLVDIKDYDYASNEILFTREKNSITLESEEEITTIQFGFNEISIKIDQSISGDTLEIPLFNFVNSLHNKYPNWTYNDSFIPASEMKVESENSAIKALVIITDLSGESHDELVLDKISATFYIKIKQ